MWVTGADGYFVWKNCNKNGKNWYLAVILSMARSEMIELHCGSAWYITSIGAAKKKKKKMCSSISEHFCNQKMFFFRIQNKLKQLFLITNGLLLIPKFSETRQNKDYLHIQPVSYNQKYGNMEWKFSTYLSLHFSSTQHNTTLLTERTLRSRDTSSISNS